jgi:RNA polymerase sigma factor (sigma-70 family)
MYKVEVIRRRPMGEQVRMRDAELLTAAKRDPEAFGELYDRYAAKAYGWARRAGLTEADALDLVAELFAQAWIGRGRFRDPGDGNAAGWLHGIARNLLASRRRRGRIELKARRRLGMRLTSEPDTGAALAERLDATASRPALEAAMDELPQAHRQAVHMRVVDELDYPELAHRLNCTETTARKWVSLGLRSLRERLEPTR